MATSQIPAPLPFAPAPSSPLEVPVHADIDSAGGSSRADAFGHIDAAEAGNIIVLLHHDTSAEPSNNINVSVDTHNPRALATGEEIERFYLASQIGIANATPAEDFTIADAGANDDW